MKNIKIFKSQKKKKVAMSVFAAAVALSISCVFVFATPAPLQKLTQLVNDVKGWVTGAIVGVGTLAFVAAALIRMISKNPRTAEEATEWMKRVAITTAIASGATMILGWCASLFK